MMRILTLLILVMLSAMSVLGQVRSIAPKLTASENELHFSTDLVDFQKDTLIQGKFLLMYTLEGKQKPFYIFSDSILLNRGKRFKIQHTLDTSSIFDSSLSLFYRAHKQLPSIEYVLYTSFGNGEAQRLKLKSELEDSEPEIKISEVNDSLFILRWCTKIKKLGKLGLVEKLKDSTVVHYIPIEIRGNDSIVVLKQSILSETKNSTKFMWFSYQFPLTSSRNLKLREKRLFENKSETQGNSKLKDAVKKFDIQSGPEDRFQLPFVRGSLVSENQTQNYSNPFSIRPPSYSRLYLNLRLNTPILPVKISGFMSTENNLNTNMNSFRIHLDEEALSQRKELKKAELDQKLRRKLNSEQERLKELENQLFHQRQKLNLDSIGALNKKVLTEKLKKQLEQELTRRKQKLKQQLLDSASNMDSIAHLKEKAKIAQMELELDSLNNLMDSSDLSEGVRNNQLDSGKQVISKIENQIRSTRDNIEKIKALIDKIQNFQPSIPISLSQLEVGRINPYHHEFTLGGTMLKGGNTQVALGNHLNLNISIGKASAIESTKPIITTDELEKSFERNTYAMDLEYKIGKRSLIGASFAHFYDSKKSITNNGERYDSKPLALFGEFTVNERLKIAGDLAFSWNRVWSQTNESSLLIINSAGKAYEFGIEGEAIKDKVEISATIKQMDPNFFTAGNPYLRTNFREYQAEVKTNWWKKRIRVDFNYSYNRDNLDNANSHTSSLYGWGASLSTRFKKLPNLLISYKPFTSSSVFNPTEYNIVNPNVGGTILNPYFQTTRTSLFLVNLSYSRKISSWFLQVNSMSTKSSISFDGKQTNQNLHTTTLQASNKDHQVTYTFINSESPQISGIDSFSFNSHELTWTWELRKLNLTNGLGIRQQELDKIIGFQTLGIQSSWKRFTAHFLTEIGWWNREFYNTDKIPVMGRLRISYNF